MKRERRHQIRLSEEEYSQLKKKSQKAGMTISEFLRTSAQQTTIMEAPNANVDELVHEIRRVGRNVDQLLARANTFGFIDTELMRQVLCEAVVAEQKIVDAYTVEHS